MLGVNIKMERWVGIQTSKTKIDDHKFRQETVIAQSLNPPPKHHSEEIICS